MSNLCPASRSSHRALTLIEVAVILLVVMLVLWWLLSRVRPTGTGNPSTCIRNLRGIASAMASYAAAERGELNLWAAPAFKATTNDDGVGDTTYVGELASPTVNRMYPTDSNSQNVSVTRGFWMLIRVGYVTPRQFVCPSSDDRLNNDQNPEMYYDFSSWNEVSYGMQVPFGRYGMPKMEPADPRAPLAADKGPWGAAASPNDGDGNKTNAAALRSKLSNVDTNGTAEQWKDLNSPNHAGEGQHMVYSDIHVDFVRRPIDGTVGYDNCYTRWSNMPTANPPTPDAATFRGIDPGQAERRAVPLRDTDTLIYP
jgi:hypothetical protein